MKLRSKPFFKFSAIPAVLFLSMIVVNVLLVKQNLAMRKQLTDRANAVDPARKSLKQGELVPPISGTDLDGRPYHLQYNKDDRKHLLLYFSPSCVYCVQQASLWRDLLNEVDPQQIQVLGLVNEEENKEAVTAHAQELGYFNTRTRLPIIFVSKDWLARYKLIGTPTTLMISDEGRVEHAWVGKWDENRSNEVTAALQ